MSTIEMEILVPAPAPGFPVPPNGLARAWGPRGRWLVTPRRWLDEQRTMVVVVAMLGIGLISAYDFYLTIATLSCLPEMEQNPVARKIMGLDGNNVEQARVATFLGLKFAGNVVVLAALGGLGMARHRCAVPVALGVFGCQLYLLYVLCDPAFAPY